MLSGPCANGLTVATELAFLAAIITKLVLWVAVGEVFMLKIPDRSSSPQLRFSTAWADTYDFHDVAPHHALFAASSVLDALVCAALLLHLLKCVDRSVGRLVVVWWALVVFSQQLVHPCLFPKTQTTRKRQGL